MVRVSLAVSLAAALAACRPAPAADPASAQRMAKVEERLDRLELALSQVVSGTSGAPATPEVRLLRVEQRLDKIIGFLKQAVRPELDTSVTYAVPIDPSDPVLGPADAKVTVIEAYEFLCPYCAMIAPTVDKLRAQYPKDVRVVSKYYLIHGEPALPAGQGACAAAKQGKYAAYEKAVWAAIWPEPGKPAVRERATAEEIEKLAKGAGLDLPRFKKDLASADCQGWVERSGEVLQKFGAGGTPSFYVNGRYVASDALEEAIDEAMRTVERSGVAPARYYQEVVMKGAAEATMISPFD